MEFHEIANMFPLMEGAEFDALVADIKKNGLLEPIWLYEDKILDGRNRYRACQLAGVEPQFVKYTKGDPLAFVISANLHRRHLNAYQRSKIVLKLKPLLKEKAKERQKRKPKSVSQISVEQNIDTQKELARIANVSHDTIAKVETIAKKATDKQKERVRAGKSSINAIYKEIKRVERKQELKKMPTGKIEGKYNVLLADPPWQYDSRSTSIRGVADDHYPTMTIEEIQALPVKEATLENAVLFLWTTTSMIKKAFSVIDAWGFEFKTSMVWVKSHIGTGFYVRSRHEIILIGVKGSFLPMTMDIPESVFFADKDKHSKKPSKIYDIIESMYPEQKYLELFQRGKPGENWTGWGLESNV
ncbi:MAG: MT-A70 family methyltransferase [Candidatus Syntrophoarchaeum sp.]|nr:MT-A70 family methyltransferase [Candidatus Syntrophoarchaeum sp.]